MCVCARNKSKGKKKNRKDNDSNQCRSTDQKVKKTKKKKNEEECRRMAYNDNVKKFLFSAQGMALEEFTGFYITCP